MNGQTDRLKSGLPLCTWVHMDVYTGAWKNLEENKSHFGRLVELLEMRVQFICV